MLISIVSPVYKAEDLIDELLNRIISSLEVFTFDYEIILVEDGSLDKSWEKIEQRAAKNAKIKAFKLSRNFGQHYAITAGLANATGEWVVVMDCDLQDQPEEIINLYKKAKEGYSIVLAKRIVRNDTYFKRLFSGLFYKMLGYFTDTKQSPEVANFGIYHKNVIEAVLRLNDYVKFFPAMIKWVGFTSTSLNVDHAPRFKGESSYDFKKLLKLGTSVILSFSDKPLKLTIRFGVGIVFLAMLFILYNLYLYMNDQIKVLGYTSLIFSIWFFLGVMLIFVGVLGLYVGRIFDQVKNRPVYIIEKELNKEQRVVELKSKERMGIDQ
jgi:glycosyltransferase involved in cell wall biosynthesis